VTRLDMRGAGRAGKSFSWPENRRLPATFTGTGDGKYSSSDWSTNLEGGGAVMRPGVEEEGRPER